MPAEAPALLTTPLHALHVERGARMVGFAGYDMPVNYPGGIIAEHKHCRASAALFDVSHMGQLRLVGDDAAKALETLVPMDVLGLGVGKQRYAFFTNASGGLLDDLMITRREHDLLLVVNAGCKVADTRHLLTNIGHRCAIVPLPERALLALQGPQAAAALAHLNAEVRQLTFMTGGSFTLAGAECYITRSGYTGEDGFEISVHEDAAVMLARKLLNLPEVHFAGLGARDTLRLEAGLCLYGHDIDATTSPIEAGLTWAIQKVRRAQGERASHYPGANVIDAQLSSGVSSKRVGLLGLERAPVREGAPLFDERGHKVGKVTSGTIGPSIDQPIAMGYVDAPHAHVAAEVFAEVRGRKLPMRVTAMPFVPHRYFRG
jgi:aminomethyltransferase